MGFMAQRGEESTIESAGKSNPSEPTSPILEKQVEGDHLGSQVSEQVPQGEEAEEKLEVADVESVSGEQIKETIEEPKDNTDADHSEAEVVSPLIPVEVSEQKPDEVEHLEIENNPQEEERLEEVFPTLSETVEPERANSPQEDTASEEKSSTLLESLQPESTDTVGPSGDIASVSTTDDVTSLPEIISEHNAEKEDVKDDSAAQAQDTSPKGPESQESSASDIPDDTKEAEDSSTDKLPGLQYNDVEASKAASDLVTPLNDTVANSVDLKQDKDAYVEEQHLSIGSRSSDTADSVAELKKVQKEMKMMEAALNGAARQAQVLKLYTYYTPIACILPKFFMHTIMYYYPQNKEKGSYPN